MMKFYLMSIIYSEECSGHLLLDIELRGIVLEADVYGRCELTSPKSCNFQKTSGSEPSI